MAQKEKNPNRWFGGGSRTKKVAGDTSPRYEIGVIGLGVMGASLAKNFAGKGVAVAVYNRSAAKTAVFLEKVAAGETVGGCDTLKELVASLKRPAKIILMVPAGEAVDLLLNELTPLLSPGDVVIDGGNSYFKDTERRLAMMDKAGLLFVGCGISGGEAGALAGPSMMAGGNVAAWEPLRDLLQLAAARADDGSSCCQWMGAGGAGHYVKMVHNAIEYAEMQLIGEGYMLLRQAGFSAGGCRKIFARLNKGELSAFLLEITVDILGVRDQSSGLPLLEMILDVAGQKGTGSWTVESALELQAAVPSLAEALFARNLSNDLDLRRQLAQGCGKHEGGFFPAEAELEKMLFAFFYCSRVMIYQQAFGLLKKASDRYEWHLDFPRITEVWRAGCIIRSAMLKPMHEALLASTTGGLLEDEFFIGQLKQYERDWRRLINVAAGNSVPVPVGMASLSYFDGGRCGRLPANLIQAQRDYFGAHTYERIDRERGIFFHSDWKNSIE